MGFNLFLLNIYNNDINKLNNILKLFYGNNQFVFLRRSARIIYSVFGVEVDFRMNL